MSQPDDDHGEEQYYVVINGEEQYSIWPEIRQPPDGWTTVGSAMPKTKCLAYIDEVWTDMRPASLRRAMAAAERETGNGQ